MQRCATQSAHSETKGASYALIRYGGLRIFQPQLRRQHMSENNSPSEESNQEPSSVPDEKTDPTPDEKTEPNLVHSDTELDGAAQVGNTLFHAAAVGDEPLWLRDAKAAEKKLNDAMLEKDSLAATETLAPPPSDHGWLEQFKAFGGEAFAELEKVAAQGLLELESDMLVQLSAKLIRIAHTHDASALDKLLDSVDDLN
jgi:hypothetical protein